MAAPKQDPLEILDKMFNEVLVQTGKHLKAHAKDGPRNVSASNAIRAKTSDSLATYHYALDDLESEIIRAKAVILRDLEKLHAARAPVPAPAPAPQPVAPPAPMMELPSSAAHTMSAPAAFAPKQESKPAAPFPDMGVGMSTDVVDLTSGDKKPSPRVPPGAIRPPVRATPPMKNNEVKPSPKQPPKPSPKLAQPPKVTPVPLPQIPRLQPPQPPVIGPGATAQSQSGAPNGQPNRPVQITPAAQAGQDATLNAMLMPGNVGGGDTNAAGGGNTLGFTDMQFSLAPSNTEASGAPPAPMPEFDLTTFAPQEGGNNVSLDSSKHGNTNTGPAAGTGQNNITVPQQQPKEEDKTDTNLDDLFNLDNTNGGTDNMFDLGGGGVNDSTFDDMFFDNNNDTDLAHFDEEYFNSFQ
ncbi:hypothetical protein Daesc_008288 [Daldinia eschscholtzii]|uniref:Uncharacterized protein n=1 Tax=Daldinia eschscholtzii TaxID=292717 RepID=A0AAX6MBD7_9PEZI